MPQLFLHLGDIALMREHARRRGRTQRMYARAAVIVALGIWFQKPSFLMHLASTAKVSDFWGLNCVKSRPNFYVAETLLLRPFRTENPDFIRYDVMVERVRFAHH